MKYNYRFTLNDRISIKLCQEDITKFRFWKLTDIRKLPANNKVIISGKNHTGALIPVYEIKIVYIRSEKHYKLSLLNMLNEKYQQPHTTHLSLREAILKGCGSGLSFNLHTITTPKIINELKLLDKNVKYYACGNSIKVFSDNQKNKLKYTITRVVLTQDANIGKIGYQVKFADSGKINHSINLSHICRFIEQTEIN